MNILSLFILIPLLTIIAILFSKNMKQTRVVSAIGMGIQLIMAGILVYLYLTERNTGNTAAMLFYYDAVWFPTLNIIIPSVLMEFP